ncbi:MAG: D-fructose-6-phosphate amidotransferase [Rhodobacter sp. BACL10 MAG-121220-bin24]|jgi:uncharacterized protein (DUF1330 family)|nr:MAG: D-fructose-6-phosphate amidotransferase [Rhodobacter sp. BACL10 MAG-121220-bin24]
MPPAYLIVDTLIEDHDAYDRYKALTKPLAETFGGEYLARGGELHVEQNDLWTPTRIVVVKFPSMDHAKRFLNSPDYQPIKAIRLGASKSNAILVEGF